MGTTTTTFALNKPTVGGDDNAWGTDLNTNADKIDDLLDGTTAIKPNLSEGLWKIGGTAVTSTAAELNILDGVTASTAELNLLDGVTLSTTELNYVDGVTSAIQTQLDAKAPLASPTFSGTVRANAILDAAGGNTATINGKLPLGASDIATQAEAQAGTDNTKLMTPLRTGEAILSQFNVTGSAPTYACRAWVNFNGTGTVAIRDAGNVTSLTDLGVGLYRINFTTAMPDANFAVSGTADRGASPVGGGFAIESVATTSCTIQSFRISGSSASTNDALYALVAVHR